jgi:hypothetical protein
MCPGRTVGSGAARYMNRYINNSTNASQERDERTHSGIGGQSAIVGGQGEEDWLFNVPSCPTRYWDIFDSIDFTCSGSTIWESPRMAAPTGDGEASTTTTPRESGASAGGGTPSSDGTAMPQWRGRGGGGGIARHGRCCRGRTDRARRIISAHRGGKVPPPRSIAAAAAGTTTLAPIQRRVVDGFPKSVGLVEGWRRACGGGGDVCAPLRVPLRCT